MLKQEEIIEKYYRYFSKGTFISFGQLLESMLTSQYRLTASNIQVSQKELATKQLNLYLTLILSSKEQIKIVKKQSLVKNRTIAAKNYRQ